jgi:AraC-like DNA-binding protein
MGVSADFGFELVEAPNIHEFDVASIAALHAPTLRDALATLTRYKRLTCPELIEVRETRTEARVHVSWFGAEGAPPTLLIDAAFTWLLSLATRGLGERPAPLRVELARREQHLRLLRRRFGGEVRFNVAHDAIVLPVAALGRPLVTHNAGLLETMAPGLEAALRKHLMPASLSDRVKASLLKRMQGKRPSIDDVALDFGLSARTVQRRLEEAGTSYQRLLDEVRRETATRLLSSTDLEPGEERTRGSVLG